MLLLFMLTSVGSQSLVGKFMLRIGVELSPTANISSQMCERAALASQSRCQGDTPVDHSPTHHLLSKQETFQEDSCKSLVAEERMWWQEDVVARKFSVLFEILQAWVIFKYKTILLLNFSSLLEEYLLWAWWMGVTLRSIQER